MAILLRKPRVLYNSITQTFYKSTVITSDVASDAITEFTDDLLSKSKLRWQIQQQKQNIGFTNSAHTTKLKDVANFIDSMKQTTEKSVSEIMFLSVDFDKLNENHTDHLVLTACRDKNNEFIEKFVDQCIDRNKVISENSVLIMCEHFSTQSDSRTLTKVIELCKCNNRSVYDKNCEFKHFLARNLWEKGNSDGALTLLDEAYEQANITVKTSIRLMFRFIVNDTVDKKSEAVLVRLIRSAVHLHEQLNEPAVLLYIWKVCFLSSWYSNQVFADQIFNDHTSIRIDAAKSRGIISYNALCTGDVDLVHRLIQAFLKFEMKEECKLILELLFEYQYECKNLRACSEILKTSLELDINLNNTYNHKLLNLLMGGKCTVTQPKKHVTPKFDFKF